jgi:hypothetical protein
MNSNHREIRVRPIVRYVVTDYRRQTSTALGEYASVVSANLVASALAYQARSLASEPVELELSRSLRIETIRGPSAPRPTVRYELLDTV